MVRKLLGVLIGLVGMVVGIWVGLIVMIIGGIMQVVDGINASPLNGGDIAWGIVRACSGGVGGIVFILFAVAGFVLAISGEFKMPWLPGRRRKSKASAKYAASPFAQQPQSWGPPPAGFQPQQPHPGGPPPAGFQPPSGFPGPKLPW